MFNTITEDSSNPLIVYTRDELKKLRDISDEAKRTRFRRLDPSINNVYHPDTILEDKRLLPETNGKGNKELIK